MCLFVRSQSVSASSGGHSQRPFFAAVAGFLLEVFGQLSRRKCKLPRWEKNCVQLCVVQLKKVVEKERKALCLSGKFEILDQGERLQLNQIVNSSSVKVKCTLSFRV